MTVRRMTINDLEMTLDWAADEGWNPGLSDAQSFFATDPDGFFLKEHNGQPVAAVSVVNHDDQNAFLGLYLCKAEDRGKGFGLEVWKAALGHADGRCVGLDGVPDQQANYARSGFASHGKTTRYQGRSPAASRVSTHVVAIDTLVAADAQATGVNRKAFAASWYADEPTRKTIILSDSGSDLAFATVRKCLEGAKIGPLHAETADQAQALLAAAGQVFGNDLLFIDVPETSPALIELLTGAGFDPVFETARMYAGAPPAGAPPKLYSIATMELG